jgi:hypothetical protein
MIRTCAASLGWLRGGESVPSSALLGMKRGTLEWGQRWPHQRQILPMTPHVGEKVGVRRQTRRPVLTR